MRRFFFPEFLDEFRLINFMLDNYKNLCYNLDTVKKRRNKKMKVTKMGKLTLNEEDIQIIDKFHGLLYQLAEILEKNGACNFYSDPSGEKIISIDELNNLMTEIEFKTNSKEFYFYFD